MEVSALVPGDIVELIEGSSVPADLRMLVSRNLRIDRSIYTGDSEPYDVSIFADSNKNVIDSENTALFGAVCRSGSGRGVVILTGSNTNIGEIVNLANKRNNETSITYKDLLKF
jgi:magnesium-transporting ATPase (P-type)